MTDPRLSDVLSAIRPLDERAMTDARERQGQLTKPAGALGVLEDASIRLSGIQGVCPPSSLARPVVAVFAGDHGVHAQGVTPWPQEVTASMVANFRAGGAAVNVLARQAGADVFVVDMGVAADLEPGPDLFDHKVRAGHVGPGDRPGDDPRRGRARPAGRRRRGRAAGRRGVRLPAHRRHGHRQHDTVGRARRGVHRRRHPAASPAAAPASTTPRWPARSRWSRPRCWTGRRGDDPVETLASRRRPRARRPRRLRARRGRPAGAGDPGRRDRRLRRAGRPGAVARTAIGYCFAGHRSVEPGHASRSTSSGCGRWSTSTCGSARAPAPCWRSRWCEAAGAVLREMATFDSAGVTRKESPSVNGRLPAVPLGPPAAGRRVLVVGGGHVAQRRVPRLLAAGADVVVVSPVTTPAVEGLAGAGEITWHERGFEAGRPRRGVVRHRRDRRPRRQRAGERGCRGAAGSSASAPTTRRGHRLDAGRRTARRRHRRGARQPGAAAVGRGPRRDRRRAARRRDRAPARRRPRAGRRARRRRTGRPGADHRGGPATR